LCDYHNDISSLTSPKFESTTIIIDEICSPKGEGFNLARGK